MIWKLLPQMYLSPQRLKILPAFAILSLLTLPGSAGLHGQNINPEFTLNDPSLFWPGTNAGAASGYPGQWYLQNEMTTNEYNAGLDANIAGSWLDGYDGTGVTIGICDSGVNGIHPDLKFDPELSWDFSLSRIQNLSSPMRGFPHNTFVSHGTSCAGVAAGRGVGIGIAGAAPRATIASETTQGGKGITGEDEDLKESAIYLWEGQKDKDGKPNPYVFPKNWNSPWYLPPIPVKNHSYSVPSAYRLGSLKDALYLQKAVQLCSSHRIINVLSAGNERAWYVISNSAISSWNAGFTAQDTTKKIANSFPGQLVVAALSSDGTFSKYSSFGACVFVTAPSDDSGNLPGRLKLVSTDFAGPAGANYLGDALNPSPNETYLGGGTSSNRVDQLYNYNTQFGGTSAAAPLVSGIMANGITANPYLDVRTAQHLLARTCRQIDPNDQVNGGWVTNNAGYAFDPNYGFGLIDSTAFTTACAYVYDALALGLNPLSPEQSVSNTKTNAFYLVDIKKGIANPSVSIPVTLPKTHTNPIESITLQVSISGFEENKSKYYNGTNSVGAYLGDISIRMTSPSGTTAWVCFNDAFPIPDPTHPGSFLTPSKNNFVDLSPEYYSVDINKVFIFRPNLQWQYLSWSYFGEKADGTWTVQIFNNSPNRKYSKNLKVEGVKITATLGSFDTRALGNMPLANGPTAVR